MDPQYHSFSILQTEAYGQAGDITSPSLCSCDNERSQHCSSSPVQLVSQVDSMKGAGHNKLRSYEKAEYGNAEINCSPGENEWTTL
jgi:hypothetical protein